MSINKNTGRPISKNVDYFPHKCKDDKELTFIRHKYKSEGYEVFYRTQQALGDAENHFIDLNDEIQKSMFYMIMQVSKDLVNAVIKDLVLLGWLDKETFNDGYLWSDKFIESIRAVYIRRKGQVPQKKDIYRVSTYRNTSIVENSKVKDSIVENSRESKDEELSLSDFKKEYPQLKDVTKSLDKYKSFTKKPTKEGARNWLNREKNIKPPEFKKSNNGSYLAWCSKCFSKQFPNDYQIKQGSECCRVEYLNEKPTKNQTSSNLIKEKGVT